MPLNETIVKALKKSRKIADQRHAEIIKSTELERGERELLLRAGWLQPVIRGWYMLARPDIASGDSTAWYANSWDFLRVYLTDRFAKDYCLSAESSLDLLLDEPFTPRQVIVMAKKGGTVTHQLPFDTSVLIYEDSKSFPSDKQETKGFQTMTLAYAICKVSPAFFKNNAQNTQIALQLVNIPDLIRVLLKYQMKTAAARVSGAYLFLGNKSAAQEILSTLSTIGINVSPDNPFLQSTPTITCTRPRSPYAARIKVLWENARGSVIENFTIEPYHSINAKNYLDELELIYEHDAYNSLSIEGYNVNYELIERVMDDDRDPDKNSKNYDQKNALAARGYYEAFLSAKSSIKQIFDDKAIADVLKQDFQLWYRNLFPPSVRAGILTTDRLIGYREDRVFIKNSRHTPPQKDGVVDAMEALFDCLNTEASAAVRAVLGHYVLVFIHPYMEGNGRMARFLMNVMFASGGYNWTVVQLKNRNEYMALLAYCDETKDFSRFTKYIVKEMLQSQRYIS
jgi:Fic/DOC family